MGFTIKGPSINKSNYQYEVEGDSIRFSLAAIKGVGIQALKEIIRVRKEKSFPIYLMWFYGYRASTSTGKRWKISFMPEVLMSSAMTGPLC